MVKEKILSGPIAYLTGEYPRATDTFIQREVMALRGLGVDVNTCSIRKTGPEHLVGEEQRDEARKTFYVLKAAKSPVRFVGAHLRALASSPKRYFRGLSLAWRSSAPGIKARLYQFFYFAEAVVLAEHLKKQEVIHLHNHIATASCSVAMLASEVSGIPYSFTLHGPDIFFEPHRWRLDLKIEKAAFVACISDFCRSQAMAFSPVSHWPKLHIVHCAVEPERYEIARDQGQNTPHLTFVGRLASVKGLPILFEALPQILTDFPDLKVTLVGDGPERVQLEQDAKAMGLAGVVEFAGYRSQSDVAEILQQTDMLVLPSFAEGVPVVLMEAMAARVCVITTQVAGIPELVKNGVSGVLVPPGDAGALARAIATLLADPARRLQMGIEGREKVIAQFNVATEAAWLAEILQAYAMAGPQPAKRPVWGAS
ncbi:MAG: glycosyltransferase family 4 protein [Rhodobacteraceae bacterium]|nr:glycosyltransferase family 4 protein [Paracoccaceae bacterium]